MIFRDKKDLIKKYNHTNVNIGLFTLIALGGLIMIVYCSIMGFRAQAFIANSAMVLFLTDILMSIYDYIIAYENNSDIMEHIDISEDYKIESFKYISVFIYCLVCLAYVVTLILYRMSFDISINNTIYELFLTIALCMWTFVIASAVGRVNTKINEYLKIIKS